MNERERIQYVGPERLSFKPQVRNHIDAESVRGLAASMREIGQLQPIRLRMQDDLLIVVDGERRARAAMLLEWKEIAVIIEERQLCESEVTQRALIANCQRKNLSGLEVARGIDQLMQATGWNASEVATRLGFSNATVSRMLALLSLPEEIQTQVEAGVIPASTAYEITKIGDKQKQHELASAAANGQLTRDAASVRAKDKVEEAAPSTVHRLRAQVTDGAITLSGPSLTPDAVIAMLAELAAKARKIRSRGVPEATFFRMLRQQ